MPKSLNYKNSRITIDLKIPEDIIKDVDINNIIEKIRDNVRI
ncbi:MAG: hypothetical protein KatS3mg003_2027 [Candidatus Nitrosocaldaceae archaeon]|nr:MAG: hypothetical protein KatS3mg003_2022 [Candidatus Nitrosocaldaceae archaeon]GIU72548.1 MAG: hypothetical protein KatS3mg003_2027 [Candidatus Nitrosocaldaceae archaeon]